MPDVTFGAVSLQLKVLLDAGLVTRHAEGTSRIYRVQRRNLGPVGTMLQTMWSDALHRLKLQAELQETRRGPAPGTRRATCTSRVKTLSRRTRRTHKRELP
jgi:DNA-binding transcriptional ArsR family regulator